MMRALFAAVFLAAGLAAPVPVSADIIKLKNGNSFEGEVESRTETEIKVLLDGTSVSFRADEVASIVEQPLSESGADAASAPKRKAGKLDNFRKRIGQQRKAGRRRTGATAKTDSEVVLPEFNFDKMWWAQPTPHGKKVSEELASLTSASIPALTAVLFVLIFHLVCIYGVAKKTGTGYAWLAFVPFGQLVLLSWMGGFPSWWLIPVIVSTVFHPISALAVNVIYWVLLVGPGIARACQRPWWIGLTLFLHPIGFFVWAYLAFSTEKKKPKVELPPGFKLPS